MLWKYKPLGQDNAFRPKSGSEHLKGRMQERREGKGDNECYRETKKNQSWRMLPGMRPEKGHLAPLVKVANEIACDHVWDSPPPHISVTCSKMVHKEGPLCPQGSAFRLESTESLPACLINLLP
jgi:hypothetical protein